MRKINIQDLGIIEYQKAWDIQENILKQMIDFKIEHQTNTTSDSLLFCEHPPVYTLGKGGNESNILISESELKEKKIQFFRSNRGGDVTFHGLQQLVAYPILDLEAHQPDIGIYIRNLEEVIIKTLAHFNLEGKRIKGETGVWLSAGDNHFERKICAIGVRCSRWITMHGLALNVNTDLKYFDHIIPCGIANKKVTSLKNELNQEISLIEVKNILKKEFISLFKLYE